MSSLADAANFLEGITLLDLSECEATQKVIKRAADAVAEWPVDSDSKNDQDSSSPERERTLEDREPQKDSTRVSTECIDDVDGNNIAELPFGVYVQLVLALVCIHLKSDKSYQPESFHERDERLELFVGR